MECPFRSSTDDLSFHACNFANVTQTLEEVFIHVNRSIVSLRILFFFFFYIEYLEEKWTREFLI